MNTEIDIVFVDIQLVDQLANTNQRTSTQRKVTITQ